MPLPPAASTIRYGQDPLAISTGRRPLGGHAGLTSTNARRRRPESNRCTGLCRFRAGSPGASTRVHTSWSGRCADSGGRPRPGAHVGLAWGWGAPGPFVGVRPSRRRSVGRRCCGHDAATVRLVVADALPNGPREKPHRPQHALGRGKVRPDLGVVVTVAHAAPHPRFLPRRTRGAFAGTRRRSSPLSTCWDNGTTTLARPLHRASRWPMRTCETTRGCPPRAGRLGSPFAVCRRYTGRSARL